MGLEATEEAVTATGLNVVALAGAVGLIRFDERTDRRHDGCSFTLSMEHGQGRGATFVRVNVYGLFVKTCRDRLKVGARVEVQGELMNRRNEPDAMFTEVRCRHLIFT